MNAGEITKRTFRCDADKRSPEAGDESPVKRHRLCEAAVGITDHNLAPVRPRPYNEAINSPPEALTLAISHLEAQQLTAAVGVHSIGDVHSPSANLQGLAQPAVKIGRVHVNVGVGAAALLGLFRRDIQ